ncbi:retrotransposon protein, putative, ty1-copia subclass [Tanacetum coccineum]|uniref:Retrotransposon protein, putative, ty1-copia subclass n=1 Tax=Tanacetum coccineum TaxID=301880 RepID=A0ABQ4YCW0_9ASTR
MFFHLGTLNLAWFLNETAPQLRMERLNLGNSPTANIKGKGDVIHIWKRVSYKWIFKKKMKADGTIAKHKARLVIKEFRQREGLDYFDTYSPVTRITSTRMVLAIAALRNLEVHLMDVKLTFLNGDLEEEIYMNQPQGFIAPGLESKVCKYVRSGCTTALNVVPWETDGESVLREACLTRASFHDLLLFSYLSFIVSVFCFYPIRCSGYRGTSYRPFRSLFTLGYARDWLTFQKRVGSSIPSVFKTYMLNIPGWKSKFIFVRESLFSDQHPGLVTSFRHRPGTLSFPFPKEPFDVSLQSRLSRYPIESRTYSEPVLYLVGLACSWEGSPLHPAILIEGQVCVVFRSGVDEERRLDGLSLNELANFHDVSALKFKRFESAATIARREAKLLGVEDKSSIGEVALVRDLKAKNEKLARDIADLRKLSHLVESSKKILESDTESLHGRCHQFEDKEAIMLVIEASLKTELALLANLQKKAMLVSRAQALEEVVAIDDFYRDEFPYLDLLAYHSERSLGLLKSLEPHSLPLRKSSDVGPSSSPFT